MIFKHAYLLIFSLLLVGCNFSTQKNHQLENTTDALELGNLKQCKKYSGIPPNWLQDKYAGMVWIPEGTFEFRSQHAYPDEINFGQKERTIKGFWMGQTEVTVAQFKVFVEQTHYVTDAEKQNQAAVFSPDQRHPKQWWHLKADYNWKMPYGKNGRLPLPTEPVRYITKNDAEHYAIWLNQSLPSELEWEYAAKAGNQHDTPLHHEPINSAHEPIANYWQGEFPFQNLKEDHFEDVAPVGCFKANNFNLYDMIGNVWEWTTTPYSGAHDQHMGNYQNLKNKHINAQSFVIKGGSFLCANNYCARFRASARHPQELDLATSHVGFRTIIKE